MNLDFVAFLQPYEQITVARDQRALGDDAERETLTARQPLQHRARDPKPALGGLVGIGRGTDHDALAERHALEIRLQRADDMLFHEDPLLERFPAVRAAIIRELGVGQLAGIVRPLDDVAVRVARVAVAAAELAADIGIERPVIHARRLGRVEDAVRGEGDEAGAAEALVENDGRTA